jgi:hypothetical protein
VSAVLHASSLVPAEVPVGTRLLRRLAASSAIGCSGASPVTARITYCFMSLPSLSRRATSESSLAKDGAYMAGDRRVHHTERSRWRHTFRRLAAGALAALTASDPAPAQQAVAKIVDLACDLKRYDYFHSDDPVEAAKFVVSEAVAALWESVLRHGGFAALAGRAGAAHPLGGRLRLHPPGYGQVAERETPLAVPLARLLTTPDMWRTFAESYLEALEAAGRADPKRPRTVYGTFDETSYRRKERADDLAAWHEMLLDRFAGTPENELLDRLVASPALAGPELNFLRARLAERRGDVSQAATLVAKCLKEMPGRQAYLDFAVKVGAELPSRAREIAAEHARTAKYAGTTDRISAAPPRCQVSLRPRTPQLGASKPIRHKPVEAHMLFGSFANKATVNLCRDTHHEPA